MLRLPPTPNLVRLTSLKPQLVVDVEAVVEPLLVEVLVEEDVLGGVVPILSVFGQKFLAIACLCGLT